MKKIFKALSGKPKNGNIVECIHPFVFFPQMLIAIGLMYMQVKTGILIYGVFAVLISWQAGWGMSIQRFINEDKKESSEG